MKRYLCFAAVCLLLTCAAARAAAASSGRSTSASPASAQSPSGFVGDAAGAPDPVTGEGMSLTLQSALVGAAIILVLDVWKVSVRFGGSLQLFALSPRVDMFEVVLACVMVIAVSALASVQPAVRASRMEPIDALRHV